MAAASASFLTHEAIIENRMTTRRNTLGILAGLLVMAVHVGASAQVPAAEAASSPGAVKPIHLVYVEDELRKPGLTVPEGRNPKLVDYKFFELGHLLQQRGPVVFAANGLTGKVTVLPQPAPDTEIDIGAVDPDAAILLLQVNSWGEKSLPFKHFASVHLAVSLFDRPAAGAKREKLWGITYVLPLGTDPYLGVLRTNRVDNNLVDTMLVDLLNGMASKDRIVIAGVKAVRPKAP